MLYERKKFSNDTNNASGHHVLEYPNMQFCFLSPYTTFLTQALDQGIITTFTIHYIRRIIHTEKTIWREKPIGDIDMWKEFSSLNCIKLIGLRLSKLKSITFNCILESYLARMCKNQRACASEFNRISQYYQFSTCSR